MKQLNKNPKYHYLVKLLQEFDLLKSEETMEEVLEYTRFIKQQEKELKRSIPVKKHQRSSSDDGREYD